MNLFDIIQQDQGIGKGYYAESIPNRKVDTRPYSAQLPYSTTAKSYVLNTNAPRMEAAQPTRFKGQNVCFNEALEQHAFYNLSFYNFDNVPVKPSVPDVTKDPRYGMITKYFNSDYYQSK
jgi:hypothetical protein